MTERFSSKKVGRILREFLDKNMDVHQHRGEFVEGCLQCEKCRLIRQIAMEIGGKHICDPIFGKPTSRRGKKTAYFYRDIDGSRMGFDDTDKRVPGRIRRG